MRLVGGHLHGVDMLLVANRQIVEARERHDDSIHQRVEVGHIDGLDHRRVAASLQSEQREPRVVGVRLRPESSIARRQ